MNIDDILRSIEPVSVRRVGRRAASDVKVTRMTPTELKRCRDVYTYGGMRPEVSGFPQRRKYVEAVEEYGVRKWWDDTMEMLRHVNEKPEPRITTMDVVVSHVMEILRSRGYEPDEETVRTKCEERIKRRS